MFISQPSQASASHASMLPADPGRCSGMDDFALGCECADPALQIAMWGQEGAEPVQAAGSCA